MCEDSLWCCVWHASSTGPGCVISCGPSSYPLPILGGFCISPQKGAVGSFRRRGRQITERFQTFTAHDGVSQGIRCDTPSLLRCKSRLKMPVSWHPRYSETPKTRPMPLMHLFEGICRNPLLTSDSPLTPHAPRTKRHRKRSRSYACLHSLMLWVAKAQRGNHWSVSNTLQLVV